MNKINKLYLGLSLAICSTVFTQNAFAASEKSQEKYVLRISHTDRANSIKGKFFIRFKELLEEKHPNIKVELNEYGKLAKRKQEIDALELGLIDMIAPDVEDLYEKSRDDNLKIVNLPYLFEENKNYYKFINSSVRDSFIKTIYNPEKAYIPMSVIGEGFEMFVSKSPLKNHTDIHDKKLITSSVLSNQTFYNQLKLSSFEYSDLDDINYVATISKGNLFEIGKEKYMNQEIGEYFPNVLLTNHKYTTSIILVNKNWFNKLPLNIKKSINDLFTENAKYNQDLIEKNEELFKDRVLKIYNNTITEASIEDKLELQKLAKPMHEFYLERINRNLLLDMYKVIQK